MQSHRDRDRHMSSGHLHRPPPAGFASAGWVRSGLYPDPVVLRFRCCPVRETIDLCRGHSATDFFRPYHRGPCRRPNVKPGSGRMLVRALPTRTKTHGATLRDRRAPAATHTKCPAPGRGSGRPRQASCSASQRSASSAAIHPIPAEVIACRYVWSVRSPAAKTPSTEVWVLPGSTFT